MKENWKPIPGFLNYEFNPQTLRVKSLARITMRKNGVPITVKEKLLKLCRDRDGYYIFGLMKDGKPTTIKRSHVCWLVNTGNLPPKGLKVDHIDSIKTNDFFDNLQLLTHRANISKGYSERGRVLPTGVIWNKYVKKYQAQIKINGKRKLLGYFVKVEEASEAYQKALSKLI